MPRYAMVPTTPCFYYSGRADFEALRAYLAEFSRPAPKLNTDGSVYYFSGSGMYSTLQPGEWVVRLSAPLTDEMMRNGYAPRPDWPDGFPEGPDEA